MTYIIIGLLAIGILAGFLFFKSRRSKPAIPSAEITTPEIDKEFPPKPSWRPAMPVPIELIYQRAKYYTNNKLQFAIFQNGTIAFFSKKVDNIEESAKILLETVYNGEPDFSTQVMDDGNYMIEYSQPAFTIVFKDEIENNWDYIESNHLQGLCAGEVLTNEQGEENVFDMEGKICLFGRAKMFMDAQAPKVVKTFDPHNGKV